MALRFNKRIKLMPGVTLNIGKRGISTSIGPRGAKYTLHSSGSQRTTVGLPGSGLSSTTVARRRPAAEPATPEPAYVPNARRGRFYLALIAVAAVFALFKLLT